MNCAFTICTRSYLGLAKTLERTFVKYNKGYDFYIIIIDGTEGSEYSKCICADTILKDYLSEEEITLMKFQYNVTEYSTSIKPFTFRYFFSKQYELVSYFDPDIMFFSEFSELKNISKTAFVTPHHLKMRNSSHLAEEANTLNCGVYNCGFIAFRKESSTDEFLTWWSDRLIDGSFEDLNSGLYTDQKWIDYLPIHLSDNVMIIKNQGCNFAPWNFTERKLVKDGDVFWVKDREDGLAEKEKLCFMHFSGFDYKKLQDKVIVHSFRNMEEFVDINDSLILYGQELKNSRTNDFLSQKYKYGFYSDGHVITKLNRRIYRELVKNYQFDSPFDSSGDFYILMKNNKLISRGKAEPKKKNVNNLSGKEKLVNIFYIICFKILGADKFAELLRALQIYSTFEKQVNLLKGIK